MRNLLFTCFCHCTVVEYSMFLKPLCTDHSVHSVWTKLAFFTFKATFGTSNSPIFFCLSTAYSMQHEAPPSFFSKRNIPHSKSQQVNSTVATVRRNVLLCNLVLEHDLKIYRSLNIKAVPTEEIIQCFIFYSWIILHYSHHQGTKSCSQAQTKLDLVEFFKKIH